MLCYPAPAAPLGIVDARVSFQLRVCECQQAEGRPFACLTGLAIRETGRFARFDVWESAALEDRVEVKVCGSDQRGRQEELECE